MASCAKPCVSLHLPHLVFDNLQGKKVRLNFNSGLADKIQTRYRQIKRGAGLVDMSLQKLDTFWKTNIFKGMRAHKRDSFGSLGMGNGNWVPQQRETLALTKTACWSTCHGLYKVKEGKIHKGKISDIQKCLPLI